MHTRACWAWLLAGGAAAALAAGPALGAGESTNPKSDESSAQLSNVGEPLEQPEWQVYDQLDPRYGPLAWLTFGEVIGSDVADQQGNTIGEIDALVRARADDMFYAVIETADAAADYVAIPVDQLKVVGETEAERQIVLADGSMEEFADYEGARYQAARPDSEEEARR